ncbi:MAG: hypothetical protein GWP91_04465 [Rhodobacterales bacterium]|nr:hypothetical protein [Rhodobacterales bacterium]
MLWILLAALASAGTLRATVDVNADGYKLVDAVVLPGDLRHHKEGAIEVLDVDGTVLTTASIPDPRLRSIILPEGGGQTAVLERGRITVEVPWPNDAATLRLNQMSLVPRPPPEDGAIALQTTGPSQDRLDLIFLGDGYNVDQQQDFAEDVDWIVAYLLGIEPYNAYTSLLNIWRVDTISNDSGVSHDEDGLSRDTAYDCYYGCAGIERLVCCDDGLVIGAVNAALPAAEGVMVLINDPEYGGAGGFNYATSYVGEADGRQVAAHELGHSLVGLWDEYGYGYESTQGEGPNCSADANGHWDDWVGTGPVDAFQECSYVNYYRPTENECMMRSLSDDYCPVCRQEAVLSIYERVPTLITAASPASGTAVDATDVASPIEVEVIGADSGMDIVWMLEGEEVGTGASFDPHCTGLNGALSVRVSDPTQWVRGPDVDVLEQSAGDWEITSVPCDLTDTGGESTVGELLSCACDSGSPAGGALGWLLISVLVFRRRRS